MQVNRRRRRLAIAGAAIAALGASALTIATANQASAEEGCEVDYDVVNDWGGGFQANVTISAGEAINGWTLTWDFPSGTGISSAWNVNWSVSGSSFTGSDVGWNGSIASGQSSQVFGFIGNGSTATPSNIAINGDICDGQIDDPTTDDEPTDDETTPDDDPDDRVDNPYDGAQVYVNPQWTSQATSVAGGSALGDVPTGVWMDSTGTVTGDGDPGSTGGWSLQQHLDEAVSQGADLIQVVIYNLPGRDCAALASNGELGPEDIDEYKTGYIDLITGIMDDPAYSDLRIVNIIEIDSLPNLVTNVNGRDTETALCNQMLDNGNYQEGIAYAVSELAALGNTYNYIDAGHHGWIGWGDDNAEYDNFFASAAMMATIFDFGASADDVHGFIANTANYSALEEPYWEVDDVVGGIPVFNVDEGGSPFVDWNDYNDELDFATDFRDAVIDEGFNSDIGMLIDTSRNGWGGSERPTGTSSSQDPTTYVDESRIDRRIHLGNWCNQAGAGLGERPQASPEPNIDAYVWIKPPGESDGASEEIPNDQGKGFDEMCDPDFGGTPRNGNNPTGARDNMPLSGHWSDEQLLELIANAYPPL